MGVITQTSKLSQVDISYATNKKISNLTISSPATETSFPLTDGLKALTIRSRDIAKLQLSFTSGESGTKYITISKGSVFHQDYIDFSSTTIYLQADKATTVEILELY